MTRLGNNKYLYLQWWVDVFRDRYRYYKSVFFFYPTVIEKNIEGVHCLFFLGNPTGQAWYGRNPAHFSLEMRFVRDYMIQPGMCVFEVGGHHGHDTIVLSKWVGPTGRLFVFEPLPENVSIIEENRRLNSLNNVEVVQLALGSEIKKTLITNRSNSKVIMHGCRSGIEINMTTLDAFCRERGVWPDLLKIDVEGYEMAVLEGARETLAAGTQIQVEVHSYLLREFGRHTSDLWRLVDRHGYDVWLQRHDLAAPEPMQGDTIPEGRPHIYCVTRR